MCSERWGGAGRGCEAGAGAPAEAAVELPRGEDAEEGEEGAEEADAVFVYDGRGEVGVVLWVVGRGLWAGWRRVRGEGEGPALEEDELGGGLEAEARGGCGAVDEDVVRGEVGDCEEDVEVEGRRGRGEGGEGAVDAEVLAEDVGVGRVEVELCGRAR